MKNETVVVLGASPKPERYSYRAVVSLLKHGHRVIPIHPAKPEICGIRSLASLDEISEPVDTLTIYVNAERSSDMADSIIELAPGRMIFNPGTENRELADMAGKNGINVEEACTLVLLNTEQF